MPYLFTSESVSEGHPDKVADQISDAILDDYLRQDPTAKVACETLVTTDFALVAGEIKSTAHVDAEAHHPRHYPPHRLQQARIPLQRRHLRGR